MATAHGAVAITTDETHAFLICPYNPQLPPAAKQLGGKWNPQTKAWTFDLRDLDRVKTLATQIYGSDGTEDPLDVVTVAIDTSTYSTQRTITIAGRIIAERQHRDKPVHLAPGVIIAHGALATSAGSIRNPEIGPDAAILHVRDIPAAAARQEGLKIIDPSTDQLEQLYRQRDRLQEQLENITAQIEDLETR